MNVIKNIIILSFVVNCFEIAPNSSIVPPAMEDVYKSVAAQVSQAKKSVADYFSSYVNEEEVVSKKITIAQAIVLVQQIIDTQLRDETKMQEYWQVKSSIILRCAKILHEATTRKILKTLQEINKRLIYWLYQKEHQWQYFFGKNPLKWVMGKKQNEEIATNIEQLQHKQDELYIRLGELSSIDWHEYLMAFNNYQASYAWVGKLLSILSDKKEISVMSPYGDDYSAIAVQLKKELQKVNSLTETILLSLADTAVPHHIMRNWIRYGAFLVTSYLAYNSEFIAKLFSPEAVISYQKSMAKYWQEELVPPAKNIMNKLFFRGTTDLERASLQKSLSNLLDKIAPEQKKMIMNAEKEGDLVPLQDFFNNMKKAGWRLAAKDDVAQIAVLLVELKLNQVTEASSVLRNLLLLMPVYLMGVSGYYGYQKFKKYDYTPIRLALLAINELFVNKAKSLDDLEYGKMIYLLYNIKEMAEKYLSVRDNVRDDFIHDLERIESREYDSAAKRRIIKDMFKKYNFLGMVY